MKQSNGNQHNNIWKVIFLLTEVLLIILMVLFLFSKTWERRPEKSKHEGSILTFDYHVAISTHHIDIFSRRSLKVEPKEPTFEQLVYDYVFRICQEYPNVNPYLVLSMIYQESRFIPDVSSGNCVGLMQVSTYWHKDRAKKLEVEDFWDPYSNILIGVDLLSELINTVNGDIYYALMLYNQTAASAKRDYSNGIISRYARQVVQRATEYEEVDSYAIWLPTC